MAKNYVVLNFTDYCLGKEFPDQRSTPVSQLSGGFRKRAISKQGTFDIHHLADLFGDLRSEEEKKGHAVEGMLDEGRAKALCIKAASSRTKEWNEVLGSVRNANRIIFAAHGYANDADRIYTDDDGKFISSGNANGVVAFLHHMLEYAEKKPSITLMVCYAARSQSHQKHHLNADLTETDVKSSLAYKIFKGLSDIHRPLKVTARTGGMSVRSGETALLSETEEAIFAQAELEAVDPNEERDSRKTRDDQVALFEDAIRKAELNDKERGEINDAVNSWIKFGYDTNQLEELIKKVDDYHWSHQKVGATLQWVFSKLQTWREANVNVLGDLRAAVHKVSRFDRLRATANESVDHYGKFVYERDANGGIRVTRHSANEVTQLL